MSAILMFVVTLQLGALLVTGLRATSRELAEEDDLAEARIRLAVHNRVQWLSLVDVRGGTTTTEQRKRPRALRPMDRAGFGVVQEPDG